MKVAYTISNGHFVIARLSSLGSTKDRLYNLIELKIRDLIKTAELMGHIIDRDMGLPDSYKKITHDFYIKCIESGIVENAIDFIGDEDNLN
jgi:hypothetical protein